MKDYIGSRYTSFQLGKALIAHILECLNFVDSVGIILANEIAYLYENMTSTTTTENKTNLLAYLNETKLDGKKMNYTSALQAAF